MKRHHWLILIVLLLLALAFGPRAAYSATFERVEALVPLTPSLPIAPVTLPGRPLPLPNVIPGPAIQLPIPVIPVVSVPGRIEVRPIVPNSAPAKGFFAVAQKMFAAAPGESIGSDKLDAGFDRTASAGSTSVDGTLNVKELRKDPKKKPAGGRTHVYGVPTHELEREIGI